MNKKLYMHIGLHKTGTSAVQGIFINNKEYLYKNKINYLVGFNICPSNENVEKVKNYFKNNVLENFTNIFSLEGYLEFPFFKKKQKESSEFLNNIISIFKELGIELVIILTLREQVSFSESYYLQLIKDGTINPEVSFDDFLKNILDLEKMDYLELIENYKKYFDVKYLWYELLYQKNLKIFFNEFLKLVDIDNIDNINYSISKYLQNVGLTKKDLPVFSRYKDTRHRKTLRKKFQQINVPHYYKDIIKKEYKEFLKEKYQKSNNLLGLNKYNIKNE